MPKYRMKRHAVVQPLDPSYRIIPLTRGQNTLVDTADYEWLNQWNWCALWNKYTQSFYAARGKSVNGHTKAFQMAREILHCNPNENADHRNHDTLDNRRKNLRKATSLQNNNNQKIRSDNTSGYKGVSWNRSMKMWVARIQHKGKRIFLGYFASAKKAALAYDNAAKKFHGEFAVLNLSHS
jgi:hypothetical protein